MIVIPMAGLSRRFQEAGYATPKYRLGLHGRSLFAHALASFEAYSSSEPFLLVALDQPGIRDFVEGELAGLGIAQARLVLLPAPTLGQADTVRLGLAQAGVDAGTPLTIFNIDTFRPGFRYPAEAWMDRADGYLEVMAGSDPGFSYVLPADDGEGRVARTAEKRVISTLASTGLYWFRRAGNFLDALAAGEAGTRDGVELYVAPLYNALIERGCDVRYHEVGTDEVVFCGTPAQYHGLLAGPGRDGPV